MGFGEVLLSGFVLLLSSGNIRAATQDSVDLGENETWSQIPTATRSPQTRQDHRSNGTEHGDRARSPPVTYRLKIYQLRDPAVGEQNPLRALMEQIQTPQQQQGSEEPEPELVETTTTTVPPQQLLVPGPDLNPPVKQESKVPVKFEQWVPATAGSVAARCGEAKVTVEVQQNFLGNGQLIRPSDLTLGGCAALRTADHILHFQTELHGCGSTMTMTEEALIYSFALTYSPTPVGDTAILKTSPAEVVIECHYRRRHYVSSGAVSPSWKPSASNVFAARQLNFSLRLMTEDWQSPRPSSVYFLSDVMHIEAAVLRGHHVPLRVYVDSCVATADPDPGSEPRYPFISNHGCFSDAKLTGAKSYFMQRSQEDKLHFQLKAFRFHRDHRNSLYITCHLKATSRSVPVDARHKACSFLTEANRWVASGGDNKVCSCCGSSCGERRRRRKRGLAAADAGLLPDLQWEGTAALGPILLREDIQEEEPLPEPAALQQTHEGTRAASSSSVALLCGVGAALAGVLLVFTSAFIFGKLRKPTGHAVCA